MENLRKELEEKIKKLHTSEELMLQTSTEMENLRKELEERIKKAEDSEAMFHQNVSEVELLTKNMKLDLSSGQEKQLSKIVEGYAKSIQDICKELKSQLENLTNKLDNESTRTKKYEKLCQYLQQQKDEYQVRLNYSETSNVRIIIYLHEEAVNLQKCLKLEQKANQKDKERLSILMTQCEELHVGFIQAIQLLEVQSKNERFIAEEFTVLSENDARSREKIDHLTARVMDLELSLADRDEDMKKVLEELVSAKEEAEMVPILQTELSAALEHAVSTIDSKDCEEIENLEKQLKKHRKEDSDSSGYYSSKKRDGL